MHPDFPADLHYRIDPRVRDGIILSIGDLRPQAAEIEIAIAAALDYEQRHRAEALAVLTSDERHEDISEVAKIERMTADMIDRLEAFRTRLRDPSDTQDIAFDPGFSSRIFGTMRRRAAAMQGGTDKS